MNIQTVSNERPLPDKDTTIKILVADDHFMVRDGIKMVIDNNFRNTEILEASNGEDVLNVVSDNTDIDILIIDYYMPGIRGSELLTRLKNSSPQTPIIFISSTEEYELMKTLIDKGASGFIPKSTSPQIIVQAINLILAGGTYIPKTLLESTQHHSTSQDKAKAGLTKRQLEVLRLIANGLTDKEIAGKLDLSHHTVKAHTTCARNLLGAKTRTMAVEHARKLGLIE